MFDWDRVTLGTNTFCIFVLFSLLFHLKRCKHVTADSSSVESIYTLQNFIITVTERKHVMFKRPRIVGSGISFCFFENKAGPGAI